MTGHIENAIAGAYREFIREKDFPCIAAKAALADDQVKIMVADHLACPKDDPGILEFLYAFVDRYREADSIYHTAVIIFREPAHCSEQLFGELLWQRLQAISDLDAIHYTWDRRVEKTATSPHFSFSVKEEAFYVIGLHPHSSRRSRQFSYPALVFNPHGQFEKLRSSHKYNAMKEAVRKKDIKLSGSVNPMLTDFGDSSEVYQYSGIQYDSNWRCPFVAKHRDAENHSPS